MMLCSCTTKLVGFVSTIQVNSTGGRKMHIFVLAVSAKLLSYICTAHSISATLFMSQNTA